MVTTAPSYRHPSDLLRGRRRYSAGLTINPDPLRGPAWLNR